MSQTNPLDLLLGAVDGALARLAEKGDNPVTPDLVPAISSAIAAEAKADPAVQHATNTEPWYASRVTWGAIIAAVAPVAGLALGHTVSVTDQAALVELVSAGGSLLGAALALYGRWFATRPIGSA